MYKNETETKME